MGDNKCLALIAPVKPVLFGEFGDLGELLRLGPRDAPPKIRDVLQLHENDPSAHRLVCLFGGGADLGGAAPPPSCGPNAEMVQ